jgi:hypothetical protein
LFNHSFEVSRHNCSELIFNGDEAWKLRENESDKCTKY